MAKKLVKSFSQEKTLKNKMPEKITPYLRYLIVKTGGNLGPIGKQFKSFTKNKETSSFSLLDPLNENKYEVVPGLIYKYQGKTDSRGKIITYGRALWTITNLCAAYCQFCTRGRQVGIENKKRFLSPAEIKTVVNFIQNHPEINEIILSGGDPLICPQPYLQEIINHLALLQKKNYIDIVRIGTRLPIHNPHAIKTWHMALIAKLRNPFLMIHVNHPVELTSLSLKKLEMFKKKTGASILSQSVLLKGVNDKVEILEELFNKLIKFGIHPYYLYQNDPVPWAEDFTVPFNKAIEIWQKLRPKLSGLAATARFVIDTPLGYGKIPVPEGKAWEFNPQLFRDFKNKKHFI